MSENPFRVFIPDPEYGRDDSSDEGDERLRLQLVVEYGVPFQTTSIGTGAALAAFVAEIVNDPVALAIALFLAGKQLKGRL